MNSTIIVSLLALAGTIFGSLLGAISTSKMLTYRIVVYKYWCTDI